MAKKYLDIEGVKKLWEAVKKFQNAELNVELDCDHQFEITGKTGHEYGVAIPETTQMKFVKIQGQTRKYSINELNLKDTADSRESLIYSIKNGVYSVNGATPSYHEIVSEVNLEAGTYTCVLNNNSVATSGAIRVSIDTEDSSEAFNISITSTTSWTTFTCTHRIIAFKLILNEGAVVSNFSMSPVLVKGSYTPDTIPETKPFDNTLVNAKANFLSTGKQLFNKNTATLGKALALDGILYDDPYSFTSDFIRVLPNSPYYIKNVAGYMWSRGYDANKKYVQDTGMGAITTGSNVCYIRFSEVLTNIDKCIVKYGHEDIDYESYNSAEVAYGQELAEYDYQDMNNDIHKKTSAIYTIDGSPDENWTKLNGHAELNPNGWRFMLDYFIKEKAPDNDSNYIINKSNWIDVTSNDTDVNKNSLGIAIQGLSIYIANPNINSVEELRTWLQQNPISFVYKLENEKVITHVAPPGYVVYNGGLQEQVIDGKYLPYILTKKYAISLEAQVILNIEMDQIQQEQIDALKQQHDQFEQTTNDSITTINETLDDLESRVSTAEDYLEQIPTTYATVTYVDDEISNLDNTLREYVRTQFGTTEGVTSFKRSQIVEANASFTLAYGEKCVIVGIAPEDYRVRIEFASRQYYAAPHEVISNFSQYTNVKTGTGISTDYEYGPTYKMYVGSTLVNEFVPVGRKSGIGRTYSNYNIQLTVNVKCIVYFYRLS